MTVVLAAGLVVLVDEYRRAHRAHTESDAKKAQRALDKVNREIVEAQRAHRSH